MRVRVPGGGAAGGFPLTGCLIDGDLAVDAGNLGWAGPPDELARVRHVLLSHSHLDHVAGLPVFLDTVYGLAPRPPAVWGLPHTLGCLRADVFNDRLMPDFVTLSERMPPFLTLHELTPDVPTAVGRFTVTPLMLDHPVPTVGFVIDDGTTSLAVLTDTRPVPAVFARLAAWPRLKLVLLEASFPDHLAGLAATTGHLTAGQFRAAAAALGVPVRAIHVKPRWAAGMGVPVADGEFAV
jgi:ribonuclease BN (tRNA processing enzyme)